STAPFLSCMGSFVSCIWCTGDQKVAAQRDFFTLMRPCSSLFCCGLQVSFSCDTSSLREMAHDAAEVDLTSDRFPETKVDNSQVEIRQGLLASEQESDSSPGKHAEQVRRFWPDILLVVILAALAGLASYQGQRLVGSFIVRDLRGNNIWFEGDCPYVFTHMVDRTSNQRRTAVHPLFPLAAYPPVYALRKMAKMEGVQAVRFVIAVLAGSWLGVLFVLLRLIGCPT